MTCYRAFTPLEQILLTSQIGVAQESLHFFRFQSLLDTANDTIHGWNIKKTLAQISLTRHWNLHPRKLTWNMKDAFCCKRRKIYKPPILGVLILVFGDINLFPCLSPAAPFPGRVAPAPHPTRPPAGWNPCAPGQWNGGMVNSDERFISHHITSFHHGWGSKTLLQDFDRKFGSWVERDISTRLLHAVLFWDDALAKGCHLWTCGQTWRTSHSGRTVRAEINRGRPAPGTASSSGTSRLSLPTLLAGIFVCGIVLLYCLTERTYLSARVKLASTLPASSVEALEANQKASKSIVLPLLFFNCWGFRASNKLHWTATWVSLVHLSNCTGRMHTRWAPFLKLLLSGLSLRLWNDKM